MNLEHNHSESKGRFFLIENEQQVAEMTYSVAEDKLIVDHTSVSAEHRGEGLGVQLLEALVEFARKENFKVLPLCPFAAATFEKRDDLQDVLK